MLVTTFCVYVTFCVKSTINQLRKRHDIVITKPDKGYGVVIMDKSEYVRLLKESSINDETKFAPVSLERPKTRGRPPKITIHYLKGSKKPTRRSWLCVRFYQLRERIIINLPSGWTKSRSPCLSTNIRSAIFVFLLTNYENQRP